MLNRRQFLAASGWIAGASALAGPAVGRLVEATNSSAPADWSSWSEVRNQFELSRDHIHLSSFYLASHPRAVRDAIRSYREQLDSNPVQAVHEQEGEQHLRVERSVAAYLEGAPEEIAITGSTTMGLALVYHGLTLDKKHEILTTTHDHYSHHQSIELAASRCGAKVSKISLFDDYKSISAEQIVDRIRKAISTATRVIGITWVHSSSGLRLPVRHIGDMLGEVNKARDVNDRILLVVDGVHGLGVLDEAVSQLGADFFIAGTHKWMFGPRGTGVIWAKNERWKLLRATVPSFSGDTAGGEITPGGFHCFEHRWAIPAAMEFHRQIGRSRVAQRIRALNDLAKAGLAEMKNVKLHTPRNPALSAGLICFDVDGLKPAEAVARLLENKIIASESPYVKSHVRIAPSLMNDEAEIEKALRFIRALS